MKILGIGTTVVDRVVMLDEYPHVDSKREIQHGWTQVGGPVPVALSTAAALGAETRLLSRWGNDFDGRYVEQTLSDRNIDLNFVSTGKTWNTGTAQVWLTQNDGARTIAYSRGTFPVLNETDITKDLLNGCSILHLDGWAHQAAIASAKQMKEQGGTVVLDAGSVKPGIDDLLPLVDILIASKLFRDAYEKQRTLTGGDANSETSSKAGTKAVEEQSIQKWQALGPAMVITTDGSNGVTLYHGNDIHQIAGHQVPVVDSNGAGDIFSGAILYGLVQGWPIFKTVQHANQIAANSCTIHGNVIKLQR